MSNSWFRFRQFMVHQNKCAMKVSTDACIQGAWTPMRDGIKRILDIGTGSALLSLMMAQRLPEATIDAIEWNTQAAQQAEENVASSPFAGCIAVYLADATLWQSADPYDLTICNPPFFNNSLQGPDSARNSARHSDTLNPQTLVDILLRHLAESGAASIMWPAEAYPHFSRLAISKGLFPQRILEVRDRENSRITRIIGMYGRLDPGAPVAEQLIIKGPDGAYSPEFTALLAPFYLHL